MFVDTLLSIWEASGFAALTWQHGVMILVSFILIYLAIVKEFEPLLLLPIAFGMLLANLRLPTCMKDPYRDGKREVLLYYLYLGVKKVFILSLIFLGIGAMTDLRPVIGQTHQLVVGCRCPIRYQRGVHYSGCPWL
jgi:Na+-transporting methylmalonyl-CoA/oxaloacetate decarboxylase beta subunit